MCENCYHEHYGAPTTVTDNAVAVAALVKQLGAINYTSSRCAALDEWRLDDESIAVCMLEVNEAKRRRVLDQTIMLETKLLDLMARIPEVERVVGMALAYGLIKLH